MKLADATALRATLRETLTHKKGLEAAAFLKDILQEAQDDNSDELQLKAAFARVYLVLEKQYDSPADGLTHLKLAIKTFALLTQANRKFMTFQKEALMILGNLQWSLGNAKEALQVYEQAIHQEQNFDRKARGYLNIARVYMGTGEFYKSLQTAEKLVDEKIEDQTLKDYAALLKARLFLCLGYENDAKHALATLGGRADLLASIELEFLYLTTMAQLDFVDPQPFLNAYEAFIQWLAAHATTAASSFYLLEKAFFEVVIQPDDCGGKVNLTTRLRYLGDKAGNVNLTAAAIATLNYLFNTKADQEGFDKMVASLMFMSHQANQRLFQMIVLLLATQLLERRQFEKAARLLQDFQVYMETLELGFAPKILKQLRSRSSDTRSYFLNLLERLPPTVRDAKTSVGSSLFSR